MAYEPSGQDFVSPCLAEADLMRRVLPPAEFATWLTAFLPDIPAGATADASWLEPGVVLDATDGKLAHLDGLNLSRAWMLEGIVSALPATDPRLPALRAAAAKHREVGLAAVTGAHYAGGHWLGTFAVYLTSRARDVTEVGRRVPRRRWDSGAVGDRALPQYRQLLRSAPCGAVFSMRATAFGMYIWW